MKYILLSLLCIYSFITFDQKDKLNALIDNWHLSAANANFEEYFEFMDSSFIFLGTADEERWTKSEFLNFSKPYFDKGETWNFIPTNRKWGFSNNNKIAWFDEDLDTWMRNCRGSGIMVKYGDSWKIIYYNLTVLIENEKIQEFIKLRDKKI